MNFLMETKTPKINTHTIWCERYRPTKLEYYIGNDVLKNKIKQYKRT